MQIAYGPGQKAWYQLLGDSNNDGIVNFFDLIYIKSRLDGQLNTDYLPDFERYDDLCDINKDGIINFDDIDLAKSNLGAREGW